jgi:hypothetical protein
MYRVSECWVGLRKQRQREGEKFSGAPRRGKVFSLQICHKIAKNLCIF